MIKHFKNFFKNPGVQIFLLLAAAPALTATVILPLLTQPNSGLNVLGIVLFFIYNIYNNKIGNKINE
jgi:hypothetical protein